MHNLKIAELLCTKICHDLIGPVGAINNGTEFLEQDTTGIKSQATELITSSAREAVARLQFFRQAYGYSGGNGEASLTEMKTLTQALFADSKISVEWSDNFTDSSNISVNQRTKKIILNIILIASKTLIRGGKIIFAIEPQNESNKITITVAGKNLKIEESIENLLQNNITADKLDPKSIQSFYIQELCRETNSKLSHTLTEEEIKFCVEIPARQSNS